MTKEEYNNICGLYQALTRRFDLHQKFYYDKFYRCYNPKHYAVRGENLETLKRFENLTFRDIYSAKHIGEHYYGENYLDSNLVVVEEHRICVIAELGQVFLYLLVSRLKNGIKQFLEFVGKLQNEYKYLIQLEENGRIVKIKSYNLEEYNGHFKNIENFDFVFHLLAKTNSSFLMQDWNNNIEIHIGRIEKLIQNLENYDFSKVDL